MKLFFLISLVTLATQGMDFFPLKFKHVWKKEAIEQTIKSGINPDTACDPHGKTLLHYAASKDKDGTLITSICNCYPELINHTDYDGHTPLHYAAFHGNYIGVEILLNAGSNPNIASTCGKTPLHKAVQLGDNPKSLFHHIRVIVAILVNHRADTNQKDHAGNTFLHDAALRASSSLYQMLAQTPGADLNLKNLEKYTPKQLLAIARSTILSERYIKNHSTQAPTSTSV